MEPATEAIKELTKEQLAKLNIKRARLARTMHTAKSLGRKAAALRRFNALGIRLGLPPIDPPKFVPPPKLDEKERRKIRNAAKRKRREMRS